MINKRGIAEKLLQINAIKLSVSLPFTWSSGWKSPVYCDNRKALSYPEVRDFIKSELCNTILKKFPEGNLIAGVATAGIPWGALVADKLNMPYIYVRPQPKEHGLGNQIEGYFEKGMKTVVVEDLISTGKSSTEVINVLINNGLQAHGLISIFNYGFNAAVEAFKSANVTCISLTDFETLLAVADEKELVSAKEKEILLNWRENPSHYKF